MVRRLSSSIPSFLLSISIALCLCSGASAQATYTITDLGTLGGNLSLGLGINSAGQVAGYSTLSAFSQHAFLYSGGTMTDLGTLGTGAVSLGLGINDSGQVTGMSDTDIDEPFEHAFLYSGGTMTDLGTLPPSPFGVNRSWGFGINNSGQVTGWSDGFSGHHAFLYSGGAMTDLGTIGGSFSEGYAINASGQIVGVSDTTDDIFVHAFLYSRGTMMDLGTLGGTDSGADAINAAGHVTGSSYTTGNTASHAFLYSGGTMTDVGTLGAGNSSGGNGINSFDQVVGATSTTAFGNVFVAFLYTPGVGMVDLNTLIPNDSGWTLTAASSINDAGQITGWGVNPNGLQHAYLLTPVAIPFSTFQASLHLNGRPPTKFRIRGSFTLGTGSTGIDPVNEAVTLKIGTLSVSIPKGSFTQTSKGDYEFQGVVGTVAILFRITQVSSASFIWEVNGATNAGLLRTNPVTIGLTIGNNTGTGSVIARR